MQLGVIADDVTGGTDVASLLRHAGLSVVQTFGLPAGPAPPADAVVVSLKIRTAPKEDAVTAASAGASWLRTHGARQIYFKYCSTFDSTPQGNIGPVADRLLTDLHAGYTVATPAYPSLRRTVYLGHLFVGDTLLSESSMRDHPLTPMHDPNLVRVLGRQSANGVGLLALPVVEAGAAAVVARCEALAARGCRLLVADAVQDRHLDTLAEASREMPLVTGAAGLGRSLAKQIAPAHLWSPRADTRRTGHAVVLSGSCSEATRAQVERVQGAVASRELDPLVLAQNPSALDEIVEWSTRAIGEGPIMVFSTAAPDLVRSAQRALGVRESAAAVESAFQVLARALAHRGVRTFVVAGGETAGAVVEALGVKAIAFGDDIAPGVPWTWSVEPEGYRLALKSGNFGGPDFFLNAIGDMR